MGYLYEPHLHTIQGSRCGHTDARDYVPWYKSLGYDGIFVTDHFYLGNCAVDRALPWPDWVAGYAQGYREAKEAGDRLGLKVFFGWETTYQGDDYLIYGPGPDYLLAHPEIITWDQKRQYEEIKKAGGLVVQAHPFRARFYQRSVNLHPRQADAWEIANAGNDPYENTLARDYAAAHGLTVTCGSDIHRIEPDGGGLFAMETDAPLTSEADYVRLILSGAGWRLRLPESAYEETPHELGMPIDLYDRDNAVVKTWMQTESYLMG